MMAGASGSGPPPAGVIQNSALSFVACAQVMQATENDAALHVGDHGNLLETTGEAPTQADRLVPPGLKALCGACCKTYPDQPNPLQVTTRLKYWLGGEDPLDYISMYRSPGRPEEHIPPHWHYISFGLSDLHGDGRVHPTGAEAPVSGYGFELTFRLEDEGSQPPLWPAQLCQALARYVFTTGNKLCAGDHISWHSALGGAPRSRLRHLLVAPDAVLRPLHTAHGRVDFLQIVGCTGRELRAAQRGSGFEVLKLIGDDPECGGAWLVTRAARRGSARGVRSPRAPRSPRARACPARAPLAGVEAKLSWVPLQAAPGSAQAGGQTGGQTGGLSAGAERQIKDTLQRGLSAMSADSDQLSEIGKMSTDSFEMSSMERALPHIPETLNSWCAGADVQLFEAAHVVMNAEAASLLPLAIDGRVRTGAHFTWRSTRAALTLCAPRVRAALARGTASCAARGSWLQVVISDAEAEELSPQVAPLAALGASDSETDSEGEDAPPKPKLPLTIRSKGLVITVLPDSHFL